MKKGLSTGILLATLQLLFHSHCIAQLNTLPDGGNKKASVT